MDSETKTQKLIDVLNRIKQTPKLSDKLVSFTLIPKLIDPTDKDLVTLIYNNLDWEFINKLFGLIEKKETTEQDLLLLNLSFNICQNFFNFPSILTTNNFNKLTLNLWKLNNYLNDDELIESLVQLSFNFIKSSWENFGSFINFSDSGIIKEVQTALDYQLKKKNSDNYLKIYNLLIQCFELIKLEEFTTTKELKALDKVNILQKLTQQSVKNLNNFKLLNLETVWLNQFILNWKDIKIETINELNLSVEFINLMFTDLIANFRLLIKSKDAEIRSLTLISSNQLLQLFQFNWLLKDIDFLLILIHLSCIEIRVSLEDLRSSTNLTNPSQKLVNSLEFVKTSILSLSNLMDDDDNEDIETLFNGDQLIKLSKQWYNTGMDLLDWLIDIIDVNSDLEQLIQNPLIILILKTLMTYVSQDETLIQSTLESDELFEVDEEERNDNSKSNRNIVDIKYQGGFNCLFPLILGLITLCESELPNPQIPLNDILNGLLVLVSYEDLNTTFIYFNGYNIILDYSYKLYNIVKSRSEKDSALSHELLGCINFLEEQLDGSEEFAFDSNDEEKFLEVQTYLMLNI